MKLFHLILIPCCLLLVNGAILPSIPSHLLECYRSSGPRPGAPRRLDVLLSLIKKLELNSQLDMRMFSASLLRSLRLDGIERSSVIETEFILPYRASAFQFHKYKVLMDLFLPSQNLLEVDSILTSEEKCLLHRMLSSAVQQWERGDENVVCPVSVEQRQNMDTQSSTRVHSRCPIEEGVILTEWGTISPGTLIAAIASSLEAQTVSVTDILNADIFQEDIAEPLMVSAKQEWVEDIETLNVVDAERQTSGADISNIWVSTLAGDLAEVVINQGPRVGAAPQRLTVGSNSRWNDTLLPRHHYLLTQNGTGVDWHFTDAEILAGIDGLILAQYIPTWVEQRRTLRLSQVIDMYYSEGGVSFEPSVKACNRQALFNKIFSNEALSTETARFAHVLSLRQITVYIPVEEMERITTAAVTAFVNYVPSLLRQNQLNCRASYSVPVMDLVVATDGSWKGYDVEQFISWVGGALELNLQRSRLSLLHGNTGHWIVPPSDNLTAVFSHMSNFTEEWPTSINVARIISTTMQYSQNKTLLDIERQASAGPSTVVLIVSPSDRPSSVDLERARELMNTFRTTYFDVYFAYLAQDTTDFQNINNEYLDYSELFLTTPSTRVQDVINTVDTFLVKSEIPTSIFGPHCPVNGTTYNQTEYEDFVLPGRLRSYRIHPFYMRRQNLINVQFRNNGQGRLLACMWRGAESSHSCQSIVDREIHIFNLTNPCPSTDFCPPAHFTVEVLNTTNLCARKILSY
ncbi:uncharacterized protein LOC126375058 [Pectinophora gossypiella]|uniref:uncharacterized protein LOC126375058 n=1 Tax=Pectinophora gossypiella TaxID=13191 RepID=UPI00214EF170|nr:uncharacterized protein LOC126375058 [Pectinophora gossypiella]